MATSPHQQKMIDQAKVAEDWYWNELNEAQRLYYAMLYPMHSCLEMYNKVKQYDEEKSKA